MFPLPVNASALWAALNEDTLCFALTIGRDLRYRSCNRIASDSVGLSPDGVVGRTPRDLLAPELAESVETAAREVFRSGRARTIEAFLDGQFIQTSFRPLRGADDSIESVLVVGTPVGAARWRPREPLPGVTRGPIPKSDPLASLSARELEILGLLGRGMSVPEAAELLHRSVRTVESHRYAIGRKLGIRNQAELAHAARLAGLGVHHTAPEAGPRH